MLSYAPVKLRILRKTAGVDETELAIASGFFWSYKLDFYLITNWHNVTGWDRANNRSLSAFAAQPTHLNVPLLRKSNQTDLDQTFAVRNRHDVALYGEDGKPVWLEHPTYGSEVDVVALKIAPLDDEIISKPINMLDDFVDFEPYVGDDVFVLGYPGGIDGGHELAIWKRGSIASQPYVDIGELPKLLIDTATRRGMSGSPVIARRSGLTVPRGVSDPATLSGETIIGQADTFLGIYSGRVGDDPLGLQLGIVWKAAVLDEIVQNGILGRSPFD